MMPIESRFPMTDNQLKDALTNYRRVCLEARPSQVSSDLDRKVQRLDEFLSLPPILRLQDAARENLALLVMPDVARDPDFDDVREHLAGILIHAEAGNVEEAFQALKDYNEVNSGFVLEELCLTSAFWCDVEVT